MENFVENIWQSFVETSIWEWLGIAFSLLYLFFAIREKLICWLFAFISSAIYAYLCFSSHLFIESLLQLFYVVMAIVGYANWNTKTEQEEVIRVWPFKFHFINILLTLICSIVLAKLFIAFTPQKSPYLDALTTCFSLAATFMITKKVLENWIYWVIIDSALIYLYFVRGLQMSSVLMLLYTVMAIQGYFTWRKHYQKQLKQA